MERTLQEIAAAFDGVVRGDGEKKIAGVAPFEQAGPDDITLAGSDRFLSRLHATAAGAVIVPANWQPPEASEPIAAGLLAVDRPQVVFAQLIEQFAPPVPHPPGISEQAVIGASFSCGQSVSIYPGVVIGDDVRLGSRVVLHPGVVIESGVRLGDDVEIHANAAVLRNCLIGSRVIIHAGTIIGSDGFGFFPDGDGHLKIPHTGTVQIDDDVEIGANNTIDRGTFGKTRIRRGVKTDNLVHIAHNVSIGENTLIVAQAGIAGSVRIGRNVILAGQSGVSQHLEIGDAAVIGPQAGIVKSVASGEVISGTPGMAHKLWLKAQSLVARLPELKQTVKKLEKRLAALESAREKNRHESDGH
ncbi:MAG: UDP-3-O-(3-hydroxymyristoyl)glucosamine N-acyltransferase [Desulfosudaceae bacterium]